MSQLLGGELAQSETSLTRGGLVSCLRCVQSNIVLLTQAFRKKFVIPDFQSFCAHIDDLYETGKSLSGGQVSAGTRPQFFCSSARCGHLFCVLFRYRWPTTFPSWPASAPTCGPSPCAPSTDRGRVPTSQKTFATRLHRLNQSSASQAHRGRHQGPLLPAVVRQTPEVRHRRARPRHGVRAPLHRQRAQRPAIQQALPERGR